MEREISRKSSESSSPATELGSCIQIVTQDKKFNEKTDAFLRGLNKYDDLGFDYHVVSILGSQSTGKSTFLNHLFGTKFEIMDDYERKQTTKGVWLAVSPKENVIVIDVEGTDGRERGDDKDFERKSSLFSLTISEVLIVNVWETQIGLHSGSNMSLLRTVFDVNLHLFGRKGSGTKTCLLFTIRDYQGKTPFSNLVSNITEYVEEIWGDIVKECANAKIGNFFDLEFVGVPHKIYAGDGFASTIKDLSKRSIPADGFFKYMEQIWSMIKDNEDLDLPSQRQLLARFKCDEIIPTIIEALDAKVDGISRIHEKGGMVVELGVTMKEIIREMHKLFESKTFRYSKEICSEKEKYLDSIMLEKLSKCFYTQLDVFASESVERFTRNIEDLLSQEDKIGDFIKKAKRSIEYEIYLFDATCKDGKPSDTDWSTEKEKEKFIAHLDETLQKATERKFDSVIESYCTECVSEVESVFIEELENRSPNIWHNVFQKFYQKLESSEASLIEAIGTDFISSEQSNQYVNKYAFNSFMHLLSRIKNEIEDVKLVDRTVDLFINKLMYNDKGLARPFYIKNDVDTAYMKAKSACESYARLLSKIDISKDEFPKEIYSNKDFNPKLLVLIPAGRLAVLLRHAGHICEGKFTDVKGRVVSNRRGLPLWAIVALIFFGWNEVMMVLRSPLYLFIVCSFSIAAYLMYCFLYSDTLLATFFRRFPQVMPKPIIHNRSWEQDESPQANAGGDHVDLIDKALQIQDD